MKPNPVRGHRAVFQTEPLSMKVDNGRKEVAGKMKIVAALSPQNLFYVGGWLLDPDDGSNVTQCILMASMPGTVDPILGWRILRLVEQETFLNDFILREITSCAMEQSPQALDALCARRKSALAREIVVSIPPDFDNVLKRLHDYGIQLATANLQREVDTGRLKVTDMLRSLGVYTAKEKLEREKPVRAVVEKWMQLNGHDHQDCNCVDLIVAETMVHSDTKGDLSFGLMAALGLSEASQAIVAALKAFAGVGPICHPMTAQRKLATFVFDEVESKKPNPRSADELLRLVLGNRVDMM